MSNWKYTLDLHDIWEKLDQDNKKHISLEEGAMLIAKKMSELNIKGEFKEDWELLIQEFKNFDSDDVDDFDYLMSNLYDLGDEDVTTIISHNGLRNKLCWIKTLF